ncbi:glycosyltransferase [Ornithinimicrobium kibberense]|uniref:Glycosyltransferase n=1 Tax=Ornithinimicrobium kibberense TaxID=282060 RepID=A0ABV5V2L4_9MICO|nr:glycosyltransferase [Ornithinimicrobium kibberense]
MTTTRPFDHVLLTRFSAVLDPAGRPPDEDWLHYRLGFFYDACLPSVAGQQGADFTWLVMLDDRCPDDFRATVDELAEGTFTPVWTHERFRRDSFARHVTGRTRAPYLITTRLDSDDALAVDFMARVQAQFAGQDGLFVNFPRGIQIDRSGAVYRSDIVSSPFLSFVERRREDRLPQTVYVAKHARARAHAPLLQVDAPVMWAQVVHDDNVSNIVNGRQVHPRVVAQRFRFDLGYDKGLGGMRLCRAQVRQAVDLGRLWAAHPGELTKWAEATAWTLRGDHLHPRTPGAPTVTDTVQRWERRTRARLRDQRWWASDVANRLLPRREGVVAGDIDKVLDRDGVVLLAEWSPARTVRDDALRAAAAYAAAGLGVLVLAARDPWHRVTPPDLPEGVAVARRPNTGYDFGSWAAALRLWPQVAAKDLVVLTNDSLVGPLGPVEPLLTRVGRSTADVWAATSASAPADHPQSFFLAFRNGSLEHPGLRDFFPAVRPQRSKRDVVTTYEIGLTHVIDKAGLSRETGWSQADLGLPPSTVVPFGGWRELVEAGFPFVKRVLLTGPQFAAARPAVERVVRERLVQPPSDTSRSR